VVVVVVGAFFLTIAYIIFWLAVQLSSYLEYLQRVEQGAGFDIGTRIRWALYSSFLWLPLFAYFSIYVLPFVLTLPICAPVIALWRNPARILVFRPFNQGQLTGPLRRILRVGVAPFGHTYTLSDADIKVPWFVRIPLIFGQLALFSFRMRQIRDNRAVENLGTVLNRTWLRNVNWCMGWGKVFPIACSNVLWRSCVTELAQRVDVIFIDVTNLRENVIWEVNLCRQLGVEDRIVYLVHIDESKAARPRLADVTGKEVASLRIFEFDNDGLTDMESFRSRMIELAMKPATGNRHQINPAGVGRISVVGALLFSLGMYPLLVLSMPGFGQWAGFPRWTPWEHPAHWPGLAAVLNFEAQFVFTFGFVTFLVLTIAVKSNRGIFFLVAVQALLLLAAPIGMLDW